MLKDLKYECSSKDKIVEFCFTTTWYSLCPILCRINGTRALWAWPSPQQQPWIQAHCLPRGLLRDTLTPHVMTWLNPVMLSWLLHRDLAILLDREYFTSRPKLEPPWQEHNHLQLDFTKSSSLLPAAAQPLLTVQANGWLLSCPGALTFPT